MNGFRYATATDEQIAARHTTTMHGELCFDSTMVAILTGAPLTRIKHMGANPAVLTVADITRGHARRETVEIKLGRDVSVFDVVREFGDEDHAAGRLDGGAA